MLPVSPAAAGADFPQPEAYVEALISELADTAAKQFDFILLSDELALLQQSAACLQCKEKVVALAARLEELANVPMVAS